ncbi:MAG: hypothetical protein BWY32_00170 [bacterium ADurb.Bin243]|nr:MAG: hypothetical protein BWY32_00170 [bacterium ADurb.Bin243]HOD41673.1 hypothetical protein [Candidatus Wallbacteria bacterium]
MDYNIIIFTVIIFASLVLLLRFISALIYPALVLIIVLYAIYAVKKMLAGGRNKNFVSDAEIEVREEGLSIKYSKMITALRKNFEEISGSFLGDKTVGPLLEDLNGVLEGLFNANLELGRRASQMEQYLSSVDANGLRVKQAEYTARIRVEQDPALREEYAKALAMINETLASYSNGERMVRLIDLEMARSSNYFDIVKLKIANLCISKSSSARFEIDEICAEVNKLFADIEKLKSNFSQINFNFPS